MALVTKATRGNVGTNNWTNPGNATGDEGTYATAAPAKNNSVIGDWDFAAFTDGEIPVGATINSVAIRANYKVSVNTSVASLGIANGNNGSFDGEETQATEPLADADFDTTYNGAPSEADLKTAGRLVARVRAIRGNSSTAVTFSLDYIELRVTFTPPAQTVAVNQSAETDAAQALTQNPINRLVGQISQADLAQAITSLKTALIGQALETGLAQEVTLPSGQTVAVAQVPETDAAQAAATLKVAGAGLALETDVSQALTTGKSAVAAQATQTDVAQALTVLKTLAIGLAAETQAAQAVGSRKTVAVGLVLEIDVSQTLATLKARAIVQAAEADLAQAVTLASGSTVEVGQAAETELAQALAWAPQQRLVAQAGEADVVQAVSSAKNAGIGLALEIDAAQAVVPLLVVPSDVADMVFALARREALFGIARRETRFTHQARSAQFTLQ